MREFRYERPQDVQGAVALLAADPAASFLGGGTNLVDLMKIGVSAPDLLVDVTGLPLGEVEELPDGGLRIGALVRNSDLAAHRAVRARYPVLSQALLAGASGQLRNAATTAGNLLQRTRCLYFQDPTKPCNKRSPGTGCPAVEGEHRDLAVLGGSEHCVATHPGDMAVAMAALDAVVHVEGPGGARSIPATALHRLPGDTPERDTVLEHGELIVAVELPALPVAAVSAYRKVRDRASYAFALVSVAAAVEVRDGTVQDVRLALGGMSARPWRATRAEELLRGGPVDADAFGRALDAELAQADPLPDNAFKVPLARRVAVRTLLELSGAAS